MASIKASQQGLVQIKEEIACKGWKISSDRPLLAASQVLEPDRDWHELGPYAYGCSRQTWERFLQGIPIRDRSFEAFCQVLGVNPDDVAQRVSCLKSDWGEAPEVPIFHGRQQELTTLETWVLDEGCQLIAVIGFAGIGKTRLVRGGIGKTDISLQFARRVRGEFEYLIWRRLLNAPPLSVLLTDLIEFISENQATEFATTTDGLVTQLLGYLQQKRCLLILDNVESILDSGKSAGSYRPGYEGYGEFLTRIGTSKHQSCLLLTSRIKPQNVEDMEEITQVRSLELGGLDTNSGRAIFADIAGAYNTSFEGSDRDWDTLVDFYSGNPLALEVAARHILRRFEGNLTNFLQHNLRVFGKIRDLLDWHFDRLSPAEKTVLYWLALNREPLSLSDLKADLLSPLEQKYLPETLDTLERQLPIEKTTSGFTLQPVLIEYITDRAIAQICQEIESGNLELLNSHALIKAGAKDYVRDSQVRTILQPIIAVLGLSVQNCLEERLLGILKQLKRVKPRITGYGAGNLFNLMRYADLDLTESDFSGLTIRQANLQDINLHRVNFTGCEFVNSSFTQDFGGIYAIAFSPSQDLLAMGDSLGKIRLFQLQNGQQLLTLAGHWQNAWITSVAFSPDGKLLASGSFDSTVKLWDVRTGKCWKTFEGHEKWVWTIAFSPNGKIVASGGDDNTVRLWHIDTGDCQVLAGDKWIWAVAFNPEGNILASGGFDRTIRLWDVNTKECLKILEGHEAAVWAIAFNADGRTLASGSADKTVKLWDVQTGECLHTLRGHSQEVRKLAFSADDRVIISGSFDRTLKLWDSATGNLLKTLTSHAEQIWAVAVHPHQNMIASGDKSQIVKLWNLDSGKCLKTVRGFANWIWTIAISPNGKLLASGSLDKIVRLWDLETGQVITTGRGHQNLIWSVKFSPDGQFLASCGDDASIKLWEVKTEQCANTLTDPFQSGVWTVQFSPDGQLLASGSINGLIHIWDIATGKIIRSIEAHNGWIWAVNFCSDKRYLASCSKDRTIKLWDLNTRSCLTCISDNLDNVMSMDFSPSSQMLVSGEEDGQIKLWDIETGKQIGSFSEHSDSIFAIAFSSDGQTFASASADETIRLWNIDSGKCLRVFTGHTSWVRSIAFTPDGQNLISSSTDGTIRLWNLATGETIKLLRPPRPYEGMKLGNVKGVTTAQKQALMALGAIG
jgi:WD40 repeat protein